MDCPYVECLFSAKDKVLAVISKTMKQTYHMVPKLDDNGDQVPVKGKRPHGKPPYKEERRLVDTFSEFYLMTPDEIKEMNYLMNWLLENLPKEVSYSLIHNDFKYDNIVLADI